MDRPPQEPAANVPEKLAEARREPNSPNGAAVESCEICGSDRVSWRKCKQLCLNCGTILKSCSDL